ncbi:MULTISPECIES: SDR family NAD(P)-dependent oxidoreductase [unclassified Sphingomonas]|uniref:SDR family NAD(P)-dependent oxidoreductase n=1 Tax=unclassified Sphingomonas TaxID=196159 RepID=UPI0006FE55F9|nr:MULTISPECIES: SDR family oxidoreductase [unclassified Sphingomonas]KQX19112.1 hypothetical protein ASD17_11120 [Sphingomonas sp. Root1294]KQY65313.1 hypothetical protein ASD39_14315 [Sphingomonas sp. Root50]KRB95392.1 hypothetical protein ASE22_05740 [Sphingomonas sp. Root720]
MDLSGQVAVITGGARGIGRVFATALAEFGADVVVIDVAPCDQTVADVQALGRTAWPLVVDISSGSRFKPALVEVLKIAGRADILVNNAASTGRRQLLPFDQIDEADWDEVMAVNVKGMWLAAIAVAPFMRAQGRGRIINMTSGTVFTGQPSLAHYITSKGAVIAFTRALSRELAGTGITVNAISPGYINTDGSRELAASADRQAFEHAMVGGQIVHRIGEPDDLLGGLLYLVSDLSAFMSGQLLNIDGGLVHY